MEYPTVFTHGATIDTILHNAREALELYFEEIRHPPKRIDISIVMDLVHFFEVNDFINITKLAAAHWNERQLASTIRQGHQVSRPQTG